MSRLVYRRFAIAAALVLAPASVRAQASPGGDVAPAASSARERALPNDNRVAAGRRVHGAIQLQLEAREALWHPEGAGGPGIPVFAFAEAGRPAVVPGPMLRVPLGTEMHVTVRNTLSSSLRMLGLQERGVGLDSFVVAPGATREFRFRANLAGSYYYWGRAEAVPADVRRIGLQKDATLVGAFIVDSAPADTSERILLITGWANVDSALGIKSLEADRVMRRETFARDVWVAFGINGLSWPHTERLSVMAGDTVRWRVINGSSFPHPMHLHGFHFSVNARGDSERDTVYQVRQRRTVVTEWMVRGTTMTITWVPDRAGNWLFHCHLIPHITEVLRLSPAAAAPHASHAEHGMAGLVTGIHVAPRPGSAAAAEPPARRVLRVFITERANVYPGHPGYSYVLQDGPEPPARDSVPALSSTIELWRNEPASITVVNATQGATSVHWHGLELESFYDGVADWSGWGARVAPVIAPGDSFVVRVTPPRAGTFMYHTHLSEGVQLPSGMYGALIVHPEGTARDTTDRLLLLSIGGPHDEAPTFVNGMATPPPVMLRVGVAHRFRLINISPLETHLVRLTAGDTLQQWRLLAKDGADLLPERAVTVPAEIALHVGETMDVEILRTSPAALTLQVTSFGTVASRLAARAQQGPGSPMPRLVKRIPVIVR